MVRHLALSLVFATVALPVLGAVAVDPTTVTCKDYNAANHEGMVDIGVTMRKALKSHPKLGKLSDGNLLVAINNACEAHKDAKVIDALHM